MTENTRRIAELQREVVANPASRQFYQLGELLRRDGRWAEAADALGAGLVHHPRYVAAWVALGRAYLEGGHGPDAVRGLEQALVLDAQNPVAWRLLGEAHLATGDRPAALEAMRRCLELVPGDDVLESAVEALTADATQPPAEKAPAPAGAVLPGAKPEAVARVSDVGPPPVAGGHPSVASLAPQEVVLPPLAESVLGVPAPAAKAGDVFGEMPTFGEGLPLGSMGIEQPTADPFGLEEPVSMPAGVLEPAPPAPVAQPPAPSSAGATPEAPTEMLFELPVEAAAPVPSVEIEAQQRAAIESPIEPVAEQQAVEPAPAVEAEVPAPPVDAHFITAPPSEEAPLLLKAVLTAAAATAPVQPLPSLTLARLYVQQQALDEAVVVLERLLEREPANVEAQDLLALIRDMMAPLPEAPPPLPARERKIAALQRWLASLTLGRERAAR